MNEAVRRDVAQRVPGRVLFDAPLAAYTSMGVGGPADILAFPEDRAALRQLLLFLREQAIPVVIMGNWTNVIFRDGGYRGAVIGLKNLKGLHVLSEGGPGAAILSAEAGVALAELVTLSVTRGLGGLEFCSGIPGSVGGAVRMNAGAYGREMKDVVATVTLLEADGTLAEKDRDQLIFEYRRLHLVPGQVILAATFHLAPGDREAIAARVKELQLLRREKHPLGFRNAGSIFKNPPGQPAGKLIESAGLKGARQGDAEVSEKHGNFIVNRGQATARDIIDLIGRVQRTVEAASGVRLETEVVLLGEDAA